MSGSPRSDHWLDRLAMRRTRRQAFKAALAGAALTLPLARPQRALADDPLACGKGCVWAAHRRFLSSANACAAETGVATLLVGGQAVILGGALFGYGQGVRAGLAVATRCTDSAMITQKAAFYDCVRPYCPGFDPTKPGGPCETCTPDVGVCCPDINQVDGYACCTLPPGGCCLADGCHSGTTDCGGA